MSYQGSFQNKKRSYKGSFPKQKISYQESSKTKREQGEQVVQNSKGVDSADSKKASQNTVGKTVLAKRWRKRKAVIMEQQLIRGFARRGDVYVNISLFYFFVASSCSLVEVQSSS